MGGRAIVYYMATTVMAVILGIILVITIHPGVVGQEKVGVPSNLCFFHDRSPRIQGRSNYYYIPIAGGRHYALYKFLSISNKF